MFTILGCCSDELAFQRLQHDNPQFEKIHFIPPPQNNDTLIHLLPITIPANTYVLWLCSGDKCLSIPNWDSLTERGYAIKCIVGNESTESVLLLRSDGNWIYDDGVWIGDNAEFLPTCTIAREKSRQLSRYEGTLKSALWDYHQGHLDSAAVRYQERLSLRGWSEEVYHAMYRLAKIAFRRGDFDGGMKWVEESYQFRPSRNEALCLATKHFRFRSGMQRKAYDYLEKMLLNVDKPRDKFKVRASTYSYEMYYEKSILDYYIHPTDHNIGLRACLDCINSCPDGSSLIPSVMANMKFYYQKLPGVTWQKLTFNGIEPNFRSSSLAVDADCRAIVRTVDYFIGANGNYNLCPEGTVNTINYLSTWNPRTCEFGTLTRLPEPALPKVDGYIRGIEDMRLFQGHITATTQQYSYRQGSNRIVCGFLDEPAQWKVIKPPVETACEKNWIPIGNNLIIYSWRPLQIGKIENDKLIITKSQNTPAFFQNLRGSSCPMRIGNSWYCITHFVQQQPGSNMRLYVHAWVRFDEHFNVTGYSLPFRFRGDYGIEYCLSARYEEESDVIDVFVSVMDRESWHGRFPRANCTENIIPI